MHTILITGSHSLTAVEREWTERVIEETLRDRVAFFGTPSLKLIHGDAYGVDRAARDIAHRLGFARIFAFPAQWSAYGRRAGKMRNEVMVCEAVAYDSINSVECLAVFPKGVETPCTLHTIKLAERAGIRVVKLKRQLS